MVVGLFLLGLSLVTAMWAVARLVFGTTTAWRLVTPVIVTMVGLWMLLPLTLRRRSLRRGQPAS